MRQTYPFSTPSHRLLPRKRLPAVRLAVLAICAAALAACSHERGTGSNLANLADYDVMQNRDFPGNDFRYDGQSTSIANVTDIQTCTYVCSTKPDCVGFVYSPQSLICVFKSKMEQGQDSFSWRAYRRRQHTPQGFQEYAGRDFPGNDLPPLLSPATRETCKIQCSQRPECVGFVYNNQGNYCHMKRQFAAPAVSNPAWTTFGKTGIHVPGVTPPVIADSTHYSLAARRDYPGQDIDMLPAIATLAACTQRCDSRADCAGFVYNRFQRYCHLKASLAGGGTAHDSWDAYFKPNHTPPGGGGGNPGSGTCKAIQVLAGSNLGELNQRMNTLLQAGFDARVQQIPGTTTYRLRVHTTESQVAEVSHRLATQFGYTNPWITACE